MENACIKECESPCICAYVRWKSHLFFLSLSPLHLLLLGGSFSSHLFQRISELINAWRWPYYYHACRSHIWDSILITTRMKTLKDHLFPLAVECIKHPPPSTIPTRAFRTQTFAAFAQSALITEDTKTSCQGSELSSSRAMQDSFWSAIRPYSGNTFPRIPPLPSV